MVSKSEVAEEKERLRAIDARPIKKVAEAKARKQMRVVKKMTIARNKATVSCGETLHSMLCYTHVFEKLGLAWAG